MAQELSGEDLLFSEDAEALVGEQATDEDDDLLFGVDAEALLLQGEPAKPSQAAADLKEKR